jgi:alpha-amylase/alpha-mannosidase (GH57 family)
MNGRPSGADVESGEREERLVFAFAVHDHQPVGNFPEVVARVYERAYAPFFEAVKRYPGVKFSLHISGALLEWMEREATAAITAIRDMVAAGQCEILTGTYYEALAPVAPEHDVKSSIVAYTAKLAEVFDTEPRGMWLAERVYEPHVPRILADVNAEYTALDDWHFRVAGIAPDELDRPWLAEHQGTTLTVCPISERLRYAVPFAPVEEVIGYLKGLRETGAQMACLADDGEKFGEWPGTYKRCFDEGWLDDFFAALADNDDWLRVATLGEAVAAVPAAGPAYLPATSYREMTRWALPTDTQRRLERLGPAFAADGADGDLVTGTGFRSFFQKYAEVNFFHKRVQEVSRRLEEVDEGPDKQRDSSRRHLWRAEANDAYWHGVFGGFYLPHLRRGVKNELVRAEEMLDRYVGTLDSERIGDLDADGVAEITLKNENVVAVLSSRGLAAVEFTRRSPPVVLTDVPARRPEPYHDKLKAAEGDGAPGIDTIHSPQGVKESGLENYLVYDRHPKRLFLERVFDGDADAEAYAQEAAAELGPFSWGRAVQDAGGWVVRGALAADTDTLIEVEKKAGLSERGLNVDYRILANLPTASIYGVELTLNIRSESADCSFIRYGGEYCCSGVFGAGEDNSFLITDRLAEWEITLALEPAYALWHAPVYIVSCSECGFEKVYQGSSFYFWRRLPEGESSFESNIVLKVS